MVLREAAEALQVAAGTYGSVGVASQERQPGRRAAGQTTISLTKGQIEVPCRAGGLAQFGGGIQPRHADAECHDRRRQCR